MFSRIIGSTFRGGFAAVERCKAISGSSFIHKLGVNSFNSVSQVNVNVNQFRCASSLFSPPLLNENLKNSLISKCVLLQKTPAITLAGNVPVRTVTKFSRTKGKRKMVQTVLKRFYRLNWGIWIRTKTGRHKRLWTKRGSNRHRLRMHVFCNATQSHMLDKMVSPYFRKPKYWVDDPYNSYHNREEFWVTRQKPLP